MKFPIFLLGTLMSVASFCQTNSIPDPVQNFYSTKLTSINDRVPEETHQFGQLEGIWFCDQYRMSDNGELEKFATAYWAWKYILDGYGVQDFWYQGENDVPYWRYFKRDLMLTQLRVYDTEEKKWKISFITNHAGEVPGRSFGLFTAIEKDNELVMDFDPQVPGDWKRIIFYNISQDSFDWKAERSTDEGKTWSLMSKIEAKRIY